MSLLGEALDFLSTLANLPSGSGGQGPTRTRVGLWCVWGYLAIVAITAVALFVVWLRSPSFEAFDAAGLPFAVMGVTGLFALIPVHVIAALVANRADRRAYEQRRRARS